MFQRPLICTNLADGLYRLVNFMPSLASSGIQHITFLHVLPLEGRGIPRIDERKAFQARERLTVPPEQIPDHLEVQVEIQGGNPTERILATATSNQCDGIILGTESRTLLTEKLFGSTMVGLCQNSHIPVLVMRPQLLSTFTNEELDLRCRHLFRYFLVPYNASSASEYLVSQIQHFVERSRADKTYRCLLLTVIEDSDRLERILHESNVQAAEAKLAEAKAKLERPNLLVETKVDFGELVGRVLTTAIDYDITAIAIASDSMGTIAAWSKGSCASEILRQSWHPVLFFPKV